ncbi:MAG TPA: hypothetical protein VLH10_13555 [Yinghuangia sp.]|nr:hypothetical protein [Yinghuangia sp.]
MQQKSSSRTIRRAAAVAIAAGALTAAVPVAVWAIPALNDEPAPVLADTGASGKEPAILTAGVAMLVGGAAVVGAARFRAVRAERAAAEEDEWEDDWDDEEWDDDPEPAAAVRPTTAEAEPPPAVTPPGTTSAGAPPDSTSPDTEEAPADRKPAKPDEAATAADHDEASKTDKAENTNAGDTKGEPDAPTPDTTPRTPESETPDAPGDKTDPPPNPDR